MTRASSRAGSCASEQTPLELLSLDQSAHFDAQFFLTPRVGPEEQAPCSIMRHRLVDHVWMEEVTVTNHLHETSRLRLMLEVDADFADLFEVKDGVIAERDVTYTHDDASLTLAYEHGEFRRSVTIAASSPATITRAGFAYELELAPGEQWSTSFTISPLAAQPGIRFARRKPRGTLEELRSDEVGRARDVAGPRAGPGGRRPGARCAPTARASATSARCAYIRTSPRARRCPRPDCRGSWRCSVATA